MSYNKISFDPLECARALAHSTDDEQAAFVNAFCEELHRVARTHFNAQMQISWVRDHLTSLTLDILGPS